MIHDKWIKYKIEIKEDLDLTTSEIRKLRPETAGNLSFTGLYGTFERKVSNINSVLGTKKYLRFGVRLLC